MKKLIVSKTFIAGILAVLCIAILAVCFLWGNDEKSEFVPDPAPAGVPADRWTENPSSDTVEESSGGTSPGENPAITPEGPSEEYPKVVEDSKDEVVIDFTEPEPTKEPPPENPPTQSQTPSAGGNPQESSGTGTPAPGNTNDKGEVYDPVFGWVKPAEVIQESIDNEGDPNKMVGDMH
jgi:hypothetical protein